MSSRLRIFLPLFLAGQTTMAMGREPQEPRADSHQEGQPADSPPVVLSPPQPPPAANPQLNLAVGMQFIQQSAGSFDKLEKEVQLEVLRLAQSWDDHAFENA